MSSTNAVPGYLFVVSRQAIDSRDETTANI